MSPSAFRSVGDAMPAIQRTRTVPFSRTLISSEARDAAIRVLESGWVTMGPQTVEFEDDFAAYLGVRNAIAVSSCTAAIQIALRALRLPAGSPVLTPTLTFCGAVHAILQAGLRPVLVDVAEDTLLPDARSTAEAAKRAVSPAAMVVHHMAGHPAPVRSLAVAAGLPLRRVVEDAAHGLGAAVEDTPVGAIAPATCFSFYATKNLPAGEGGAVTTEDDELAAYARRARLHGMSDDAWKRYAPGAKWRYDVIDHGLKANPTDVTAAIARAQLRHFDEWQRRRHQIAVRYDTGLVTVPGLVRPVRPPVGRHAWHLYVVRVTEEYGVDRDTLIHMLASRGIGTSVHFVPVHHHPYFRRVLGKGGCENLSCADRVFPQLLSLPMHQSLSDEDVDYVCEVLADIESSRRSMIVPPACVTHGFQDEPSCRT